MNTIVLIIHQIFALACDCYKWDILVIFPNLRVLKTIRRIMNKIASFWLKKIISAICPWSYLFLEDHSFSLAAFLEKLFDSRNRECSRTNIRAYIFEPNGGYCLYNNQLKTRSRFPNFTLYKYQMF